MEMGGNVGEVGGWEMRGEKEIWMRREVGGLVKGVLEYSRNNLLVEFVQQLEQLHALLEHRALEWYWRAHAASCLWGEGPALWVASKGD